MSTNPLPISIAIPVYNAEHFIKQCLDSLLAQKTSNFEIICVDDGSTDKSVDIIEHYVKNNNNIKLIKQKNSGPAMARNRGLKEARGRYIWFVDSDDWVSTDALEILNMAILRSNADIIGFCAAVFNNKDNKIVESDSYRSLNFVPNDFWKKTFTSFDGRHFLFDMPLEAWSRIYKKSFLLEKGISFDLNLQLLDDSLFVNETFLKSQSIYYIKDIIYFYRSFNKNSLLNSFKYSDLRHYNLPIYVAERCQDILKELTFNPSDFKKLTFRNLDRINHIFPRLSKKYRKKYYKEWSSFLKKTELNKKEFIKKSIFYKNLKQIESLSYCQFKVKNFLYQKIESQKYDRIIIFGLRILKFRKTNYYDEHGNFNY